MGNIESEASWLIHVPAREAHVGFHFRPILDVRGICLIRASPFPASFWVAIDLTLIAGLWGQ